MVLKSLEPELSQFEYQKLVTADQSFKQRLLYDEIIDSFYWKLSKETPGVLVCSTVVTAALARRRQNALRLNGLWTDDTLENAKVILAPWNPSGNHWVLVTIFLPSFTAVYLDPLSNEKNARDAKVMEANIMFSYLVRAKLSNEAQLLGVFVVTPSKKMGTIVGYLYVYMHRGL